VRQSGPPLCSLRAFPGKEVRVGRLLQRRLRADWLLVLLEGAIILVVSPASRPTFPQLIDWQIPSPRRAVVQRCLFASRWRRCSSSGSFGFVWRGRLNGGRRYFVVVLHAFICLVRASCSAVYIAYPTFAHAGTKSRMAVLLGLLAIRCSGILICHEGQHKEGY
jgi:hypothetical protein